MAGRPVAARGGALTGLHYGLITFVILTVLALVLFVLQLTKNSDLMTQARRANDQLAEIGQVPAYYSDEARQRKSTGAEVMHDDLRMLATLVTGKPDSVSVGTFGRVEMRLAVVVAR